MRKTLISQMLIVETLTKSHVPEGSCGGCKFVVALLTWQYTQGPTTKLTLSLNFDPLLAQKDL